MKLKNKTFEIGSNTFENSLVPILWGYRAIFQDEDGLTIGRLDRGTVTVEIENGKPAPGVPFRPRVGSFEIETPNGGHAFFYSPGRGSVVDAEGRLPSLVVEAESVSVASMRISGNTISGAEVGIMVSDHGTVDLGTRLPKPFRRAAQHGPALVLDENALEAMRQAIQINPKTLEAFTKATQVDPKVFEAINQAVSMDPETLEAMTQAVSMDPETLEAIRQAVQVDPKTLEAFTKATQVDPKVFEAINQAVSMDPETLEAMRQAVQVDPKTLEEVRRAIARFQAR